MADGFDFWVNTQIRIETARATALAITAITKANPAVVTYTGTDPVEGNYVVFLNMAGMTPLDRTVWRVGPVVGASNTFEIEGLDSTLFRDFVSGTCAIVTLGVEMTTVQDVNSSGGEYDFADLTVIHNDIKRRAPTTSSPFSVALGCLFKPEDPAHLELFEANVNKTERVVEIEWPSGRRGLGLFYVGASGIPKGSAGEAVKTDVALEGQGRPTFYGD
jgi:hypothetical protein